MSLAAFYLELLRNAHMAAVEDGAVLTGGQTLGLGSRIDDNMLFNPQTGFNDIPAAYTIPTESREVNALADAELTNLGLTRVQLVDLLVNQFKVQPSHLAYAWDIPTYAVMHEGRRQSEELPEFYTGNPLEPLEGSMQHSAYRPNNRWTHRQGKDVSGDTRPSFDEATGMQHQVPKHPDAQGPIYEHTNPFTANSATGWAIEAAFGAVFGPTGIRIMRTHGGKAFDLLAANLDLPEPLRNQFRNIANWLRPDTKLTLLPGGGEGGPGGGGPRGVVPDPDPPMGQTGGGPYDGAKETGAPPGTAGGAEFPIPSDRIPDMEIPDADVIPFPTDRFGPADDVPLADTLDQLSGVERFRAFQAEGRARARKWWDTLSDEEKATAQKAWERHGETGQVFDPTNDYDVRNAYVIHKRGDMTPAEQWNALGDPRPQATDALYEGMTLEDIGELQGVAASEVTPAHIAEAVDAGVLSEADGARLLDPIPRTPEVPGQQSLFEEIEAMRPGPPEDFDPHPGWMEDEMVTADTASGLPETEADWVDTGDWDDPRLDPPDSDTSLYDQYVQGYMTTDEFHEASAIRDMEITGDTSGGGMQFIADGPGDPELLRFFEQHSADWDEEAINSWTEMFNDHNAYVEEMRFAGVDEEEYASGVLEAEETITETGWEDPALDGYEPPDPPGAEGPPGLTQYGPGGTTFTPTGFAGHPGYYPTVDIGDGYFVSEQMSWVHGRYIINVTAPDGEIRTFYKRTGTGDANVDLYDEFKDSGGAFAGDWSPMEGLGAHEMGHISGWFRKSPSTMGLNPGDALWRYGTQENKDIGLALERYFRDSPVHMESGIASGFNIEGTYHHVKTWSDVSPVNLPKDPYNEGYAKYINEAFNEAHGLAITKDDYANLRAGDMDPNLSPMRASTPTQDSRLARWLNEREYVGVQQEALAIQETHLERQAFESAGYDDIRAATNAGHQWTAQETAWLDRAEEIHERAMELRAPYQGWSWDNLPREPVKMVDYQGRPLHEGGGTNWEFYLPPPASLTDEQLREGLSGLADPVWKVDGPPSTAELTKPRGLGGKVAAGMVAGPVAGLAAEAAFPTQVKQVMTGLADRADSWWSWIKDYPDHLEWMTRSVGSTLDGLEKGSRSTGNQTVDLLTDGFRDQSNALLMSLGGGAVPVIGREDADLVRGTSKHLSQQGHNGQATFSNDVRKEMEAGDAMVVGYRSEQDYQRALEQAGRYGLEIDRHFWRKPNRKNVRPARGQEWTRDALKKLATTNHFYPDAGLRQGPR